MQQPGRILSERHTVRMGKSREHSHGGGAAEAGLKLPGTNSLALARSAVVLRSMAAACALLRLLGACLFWLGGKLAAGCGKPCKRSHW